MLDAQSLARIQSKITEINRELDQPFYDTITLPNAAAVNIDVFKDLNGKSLNKTNMVISNQFSSSQILIAKRLMIKFTKNDNTAVLSSNMAAIGEVIKKCFIRIERNRIETLTLPLAYFFTFPTEAVTSGWTEMEKSLCAQKVLNIPVLFPPGQSFSMKLQSDGAALSVDATTIDMLFAFEGFLTTEEVAQDVIQSPR